MRIKIPKLLAPAGNMEALQAAVAAGADEIYISGKMYGARHYAANFSKTEIEDALEYAHQRGLNVYITVNTLLKDRELIKVAEYISWLYQVGADGIIVQDLGLANIAKDLVPHLPLHASTQMTLYNLEGIELAADLGFERVILAREMSLTDINDITDSLLKKIELEIFAHGALCYSYSGLCLFSSLIGGRSGNRGMCAQPCRKLYEMVCGNNDEYGRPVQLNRVNIKEQYLLSTKELALYPYLNQLVDSNISALKIEGRMRSAEYVGVVVDIYRRALDSIQKRSWKVSQTDTDTLKLAFNRGFSGGHLLGDKNTMERTTPGNRGLYLGKVLKIDEKSKMATIKNESTISIEKGDGLLFTSPTGLNKGTGMRIHYIHHPSKYLYNLKVPEDVEKGFKVFMTRKNSLQKKSSELVKKASYQDHIALSIKVSWDADYYVHIHSKATTKAGDVFIDYISSKPMDLAKTKETSENQIKKQLLKTGGTPFLIENIEINYPGGLFAPISLINSMRRDFLEKIRQKLISLSKPDQKNCAIVKKRLYEFRKDLSLKEFTKKNRRTPHISVWVDDLDSVKIAAKMGCAKIFYQPQPRIELYDEKSMEIFFIEILELLSKAQTVTNKNNAELIWKWPSIISRKFIDGTNTIMDEIIKLSISGVMMDNISGSLIMDKYLLQLNLYGSTGLNIWNHQSVKSLERFKSLILSPELSREDLTFLKRYCDQKGLSPALEIMVQGHQELLISEDKWDLEDFIKGPSLNNDTLGIKDRKYHVFPLKFDYEGRVQILNSKELCLIDYMPQIFDLNVDGMVIDVRSKPSKYTKKILSFYQKALKETLKSSPQLNYILKELKDQIKDVSAGGITRGNFKRGIMIKEVN